MDSATKDTATRILDAAERLFVEHGFEATSLRTITQQAEVNLAAVNYHFGSKDALFQAVLVRRLAPLNQQCVAELDVLEKSGAPITVDPTQKVGLVIKPGTGTLGATLTCTANPLDAVAGVAPVAEPNFGMVNGVASVRVPCESMSTRGRPWNNCGRYISGL